VAGYIRLERVFPGVVQHVEERSFRFERSLENVRMKAVVENAAASLHEPIDCASEADRQTFHGS
jgi:hypothetical protein